MHTRGGGAKSGDDKEDEDYEPGGESGHDSDREGKAKKKAPKKRRGEGLQERVISDSQSNEEAVSEERENDNDSKTGSKGDEHQQETLRGEANLPPKPRSTARLTLKYTSASDKKRKAESDGESEARSLRSGKHAEPKRTKVQEDSVDEAGVEPATSTEQSAVTFSSTKSQDDVQEGVSRKEIRKDVEAIWQQVQNLAAAFFKATKADPEGYANVVTRPTKDLEALYRRLWGKDWAKCVNVVVKAGLADARDIVMACIAGIVWLTTTKPSPFNNGQGIIKKIGTATPFFDKILQEHDRKLSMQALADQVAQNILGDKDHQQEILTPLAQKWASETQLVLGEQLHTVKATFPTDKAGADEIEHDFHKGLEKIFFQCQIFRGSLRVSGSQYKFQWEVTGEPFDSEVMEELHEGKGKRVVAWCVSPVILLSANEGYVCVCKAKVLTRRVKA
ncbi:hypothetical protein KC316_g4591 [Hortaea werneckii]|nr:hypothetical protein KC324_g5191 [Hortaea werneckii]KAI7588220.1 hypothetical protein KC316_g4591 [Hortaea werneckii]